MNLPNAISLLRILLVAPFLTAVIYHNYPLSLGIFLVAGFSDFLDGFLARRLGQQSLLGAFLDPLGDRLLTTVAYVALAVQGLLPPGWR
ncbi:MAG: CDP-alcohol phosphatidyltransferase family protein [Trichloromonas sp.]|jgi:cardiolipin synthase|nr:CDP-alcohol phosphatidyltransferase family protein [Trichloromonas sp.]